MDFSSESWPRPSMRFLSGLSDAVRGDLLRVLSADSRARADLVRQFYERGDDDFVETLTELEADELLRL
jgi:hypothetical protein